MTWRRAHKTALTVLLSLAALAAIVLLASIAVMRTDWFKNKVRERIVAAVEQATGGRVEIGRFNYSWSNFTADVEPFVLHGTEPAGAPPLFRADRIHVRLKVVSFVARKADIISLVIAKPEVHVFVHADGTTNLPTPREAARARGNAVADILNLRIQHLALLNGSAQYNSEHMPIDARADGLVANLRYAARPARYIGDLRARQVRLSARTIHNATFGFSTGLEIDKDKIRIENAKLTSERSAIDLAGVVTNLASPRADLDVNARLVLADFAKSVVLPIEARGEVGFNGKAAVRFAPFSYSFDGRLNGRGLAYASRQLELRDLSLTAKAAATPDQIDFTDLNVAALGGRFRGSAHIENLERFHLNGTAEGISVREVAALERRPGLALSGTASGPIEAEGRFGERGMEDLEAKTSLHLAPGQSGIPVEGTVTLDYNQRARLARLGNSDLLLGSSHLIASGDLGRTLQIHVTSGNLDDLLQALPLAGIEIPKSMPVKLVRGGTARFDGTVSGPLDNPTIEGQLQLSSFEAGKQTFDHLAANLALSKSNLDVLTLALDGSLLHASGSGQLALVNWRSHAGSAIAGTIRIRGGVVAKLLDAAGHKLPVSGTIGATATLAGTYGDPQATAHVQVDNVTAFDEPLARVLANITYTNGRVEVTDGRATQDRGEADFSGLYQHSDADWTSGQLRFKINGRGFMLAPTVARWRKGIDGAAAFDASGVAHFVRGEFELDELHSQASARHVVVDKQALGDVTATAETRGQTLAVKADANLRGVDVHGQGEWRLTGDYPGQAQITASHVLLETVKSLLPENFGRDLPVAGFFSASVNVSAPLKNPDALVAHATIPQVQISASPNARLRSGVHAADLVLHNSEPLLFDITPKNVTVRSAQLTATDTTLRVVGRFGIAEKEPWNLRVNGSINLAILQLFNPDLLASGVSTVNATVRGTLTEPDVNGRLELKNASLYLEDLPNGVEKANGVIAFDRSRATVEKLSGESGGGTVTFQPGSFVGFSGALLIYHAQAAAEHVRYRSPEGFSITANANLSLAGTSERSTLSGTVTLMRAAFSPQADIGSMLASTARPVSVPTAPSPYVRGIQFDIRVDTSPNLEVLTTLTRNIQADADLRLRGNAERPILLGSISVTEGEIDFFGNKYRINRGEINFTNPAKMEPVVDMDLETRVRGVTVDITFAGPLNKLNFSYRSDPPLESDQIIALLAVGREPVGIGSAASSQVATNTSYLAMGSNAVLQQALTAPASGRLQRFFGVSHIKIDPELTDITSVPQARLSFEQQISKEITLTYITNLSRTSEQVVRVEWNLSRRWSVVAVRDENGFFGMDLQYRKAFK